MPGKKHNIYRRSLLIGRAGRDSLIGWQRRHAAAALYAALHGGAGALHLLPHLVADERGEGVHALPRARLHVSCLRHRAQQTWKPKEYSLNEGREEKCRLSSIVYRISSTKEEGAGGVCSKGLEHWQIGKTPLLTNPEAEFLDEIQTKVWRVSLLAIHSHLYWRI